MEALPLPFDESMVWYSERLGGEVVGVTRKELGIGHERRCLYCKAHGVCNWRQVVAIEIGCDEERYRSHKLSSTATQGGL